MRLGIDIEGAGAIAIDNIAVANGNFGGSISGGTNIGGNSCNGTATCP